MHFVIGHIVQPWRSIVMVFLTACCCCSWPSYSHGMWKSVHTSTRARLVVLAGRGVMGSFISMDYFLFYVFWEVVLIPCTSS